MNRNTILLLLFFLFNFTTKAQPFKKVYDENLNPQSQLDHALEIAKSENKFVICQVGGNWCPWCLKFADFITTDSLINKTIKDNFVYIHLNYNPRSKQQPEKEALTKQMMKRLNNPSRFGFPVLVVLNQLGSVIHIQDSAYLEDGDGYSREKVIRFLNNWMPDALKE